MDTMNLRWALVAVGVVIIIALFLFGNPDKKRKPRASRKRVSTQKARQEPQLNAGEGGEVDGEDSGLDERQTELAIEPLEPMEESSSSDFDDASASNFDSDSSSDFDFGFGSGSGSGFGDRHEPRFGFDDEKVAPTLEALSGIEQPKPRVSDVPLPDKIVTLFIKARDNHIITGVELLDVSIKSGLVFGDPGIFHRLSEEDGKPVFSMANLTNPGIFDKNKWNSIEILGVTMFMTLPGPKNALDAWDSMLATSQRLAELLHADLLDDQRQLFSRQRARRIKEELREFERQNAEQS